MVLRTFAVGILAAAGAFAQFSSFPKPSYFRETFRKPDTKVELEPPKRLADFVRENDPRCLPPKPIINPDEMAGSLQTPAGEPAQPAQAAPAAEPEKPPRCMVLSLKDYLELVMANNTDVQISYLSVQTSRNNVTAAYGAFDPTASFGFTPSWRRSDPQLNDPDQSKSKNHSWPISLGFNQKLSTGQSISLSGDGSKSVFEDDASFSSKMSFNLTQPLIRNRGSYITRMPIMQAQNRLRGSELSLTNNLISRVNSAERAYWDLVSARETLKVSQSALILSEANWKYVQQQYELGAISYLETYAPQQQLASYRVRLSNAEFAVHNAEEAFRREIAADLDPTIRTLPIAPVEPMDLSPSEIILPDREQTVARALANHPTIKNALLNLDNDELSLTSARNGLLPDLSLRMGYSGSGAGSWWRPGFGESGAPVYGGLGDALHQLFGWGNPTYSVSLSLSFPIRSKQAAVSLANALITKKSDTLSLRSQQQSMRVTVLQAVTSFESAVNALALTETQLDFARKDNKAQKDRYELGMVQQIDVLRANQNLADSELSLVNAKISLRRALLSLYQTTGELLDKRNIVVKTN